MNDTQQQRLQAAGVGAKRLLQPLLVFVALMWLVEIFDWLLFNGALDGLGILPRQVAGLRGIPLAPLLHGSFGHLIANTLPFLALGALVRLRHSRQFVTVSLIVIAVSGLGTWLFAPPHTVHIGASGLIFGYFAFLLVAAYYERSPGALGLALLVIVFYGGLLWGALPQGNNISWQGHLFGLIGGALAAYAVAPRRIQIKIDPQ
ncbi:MAG: rhomboid family intramembrane serine protease [Candidatus Promineofilum sp.]|jgi:membrane associated rhomboid family serine protease|nr:rhomboid family intramembrane serine protease [Promineifilum sp.]